jgi:hypothetical protein
MTHRRKQFLVYPPEYSPHSGKRYKVRFSKRQAWKLAAKLGAGASIDVNVTHHPARATHWNSSTGYALWTVAPRCRSRGVLFFTMKKARQF